MWREFETMNQAQLIFVDLGEINSIYVLSPTEIDIRGPGFNWRIPFKYYKDLKIVLEQLAKVRNGME